MISWLRAQTLVIVGCMKEAASKNSVSLTQTNATNDYWIDKVLKNMKILYWGWDKTVTLVTEIVSIRIC